MRDKVKAIISHGINCFVNRQLIYNFPEEIFADHNVMAIEHADFDGIERLALVTGALPELPWATVLQVRHSCGCMAGFRSIVRSCAASKPVQLKKACA